MTTKEFIYHYAMFPYSREYFEMCKQSTMISLQLQYNESKDYQDSILRVFNESGLCNIDNEFTHYFEDVLDSVGSFISKTIDWLKQLGTRIFNFCSSIIGNISPDKYQEKLENGETVESELIKMVKSNHLWTKQEINEMIKTNTNASVRFWGKMKINITHPDIVNLKFARGCDQIHINAFKNILTFMLCREEGTVVNVEDIIDTDPSAPNYNTTKKFLQSGAKAALLSLGLIGVNKLAQMIPDVYEAISSKNFERLQSIYNEIEDKQKKAEGTRIQIYRDMKAAKNDREELNRLKTKLNDINKEKAKLAQELQKADKKLQAAGDAHADNQKKAVKIANKTQLLTNVTAAISSTVSAGIFILSTFAFLYDSCANGAKAFLNRGRTAIYVR